jgi:uncharacterized membrane protein YdcZ (DUF606 family)
VISTVGVGALIALQPAINSQLAKRSSVLTAGFVSVLVSALVMAAVFFAFGSVGQLRRLGDIPAFYFIGGILGAALVTVSRDSA